MKDFLLKLFPLLDEQIDGGTPPGEPVVPDAGAQTEPTEPIIPEGNEPPVEPVEPTPSDDLEEDDIQLPPEQQTAFQKRMERERKKLEEKLAAELETRYKPYKSVVDQLGGDPERIEKQIRENQLAMQARQMAEANGWTEQQYQLYLNQQKTELELQELRIKDQINDLRDNPEYAGIHNMRKDIASLVSRSNGTLTVEQAYWALGGNKLAAQLKREAEQREIAKRSQARRTVQTDSQTSAATPAKPLPAEIEEQRIRLGLTQKQAEELMADKRPDNLAEWREMRKKKAK